MVCIKGSWLARLTGGGAVILACLTLACGGGGSKSTVTVDGKVTYARRSIAKNAEGVPTGLNATPDAPQVARGVHVRAIEAKEQTLDNGNTTVAYVIASSAFTDEYGKYSLSVPKDVPCFVEVQSVSGPSTYNSVRIVSDKLATLEPAYAGTASVDCTLYSLRKGLDGSSGTALPFTKTQGGVTVDFAVDESTSWWLASNPIDLATDATKVTLEASPTGSRILGILDSIYTFTNVYGDATPGGTLDLFYRPGISETAGSYVNYSDTTHYFGSLRGNPANDDAWDEAIIFLLCGRNALYSHATVTPYAPPSDQLPVVALDAETGLHPALVRKTGLDPAHALIDGLPYGMAASLLKSPYLADTINATTATVRDIRDLGNLEKDAYSAPGIAALSWDLLLKANALTDLPASWSSIDRASLHRFFTLTVPVDASARPVDTASVYKQLLRLKESNSASDTVTLKNIFTDSVLTAMVTPYNLTWPQPVSASYLLDWGKDPDGDFHLRLNMDSAHADPDGTFPNVSVGEIVHAKFLMTKDAMYRLRVATPGLVASGATLEIKIMDASGYQTRTVSLDDETVLDTLWLKGDPTTFKYIPVHIRLQTGSLTAPLAPLEVTVSLDMVHS